VNLSRTIVCALLAATAAGAAPLRIVTTFYPLHIAALNITSNAPNVSVINLTPPTSGCLHDYQLTPADLARLIHADVLIVNGGGLEAFLDKARRQAPRAKVIEASAGIELLEGNPHVWVSPELAARQAETIGAGLARLDAPNAELYRRNAAAYAAQLRAQAEKMRAGLKGIASRNIITLHEAFPYFAREFGFNIAAVVEREPGAAPGARELADTIALVREKKVRALFVEPQYPARSAEVIARATGAQIAVLDPAVTGPVAAGAYLQIMEKNLAELQRVLK
jgi:zinc transport system substrate-binding protein